MQIKEIKSRKIIIGHVKYREKDMVADYSVEVTNEEATCEEVAKHLITQANGAEIISMCVRSIDNDAINFEDIIQHIIEDLSNKETKPSAKGNNKDGK